MGKLVVSELYKVFGETAAVKNVSLTVDDGELLTVVGPSGCGKTTLLRMIAGFIEPTSGRIRIDNEILSDRPRRRVDVPPEDRDIGMVFQSYAVWPHMNILNNVAYPLKLRKLPKQEIREKAMAALRLVHLDGYEERMAYELSGGQQQRVALARALCMEPRLLLLDEPLSNLDAALREEMRGEIKEIQHKTGITIINVTHDQVEAMTMSDKVAVMQEGNLVQYGTPRQLYERPANTFVAKTFGSADILPAVKETATMPAERGMMYVTCFGNHRVLVPYRETRGNNGFLAVHSDQVIYDETSSFRPEVVRNLYMGQRNEYTLQCEDGTRLRMTAPAGQTFALGETIPVRIDSAIWLEE